MQEYAIIVCEVGQDDPRVEWVWSPWDRAKQITNNAYLEEKTLYDGVILLCDEEAPDKGLPFNRNVPDAGPVPRAGSFVVYMAQNAAEPGTMGNHRVQGNFVLCRYNQQTGRFDSLRQEDIDKYMHILRQEHTIRTDGSWRGGG